MTLFMYGQKTDDWVLGENRVGQGDIERAMKKKIAIVGATGFVGRKMLQVLIEHEFPFESIKALASKKSVGTEIKYQDTAVIVEELTADSFDGIDVALFSAGSAISKEFAPIAATKGCYVIDNSSCWRQVEGIPLVVPEVNPQDLRAESKIIANPNCSTIQLVLPLKALHDKFGLKRVVCSTYQSITGAGQKGVEKLNTELSGKSYGDRHPIAFNAIFHAAEDNSGFTFEEQKMFFETRKILGISDLNLAYTCVRLPILGGHCESVNIELEQDFTLDDVRQTLANFKGITVVDDLVTEQYPTPITANESDQVFVGRIRKDDSVKNGLYLWVVSDNIRKGAATNTVQIAEKMLELGIL